MEKKLRALFDFQKFDGNSDLQQVINSVHARYAVANAGSSSRELNLDEMEWVAAAGKPEQEMKKNERD